MKKVSQIFKEAVDKQLKEAIQDNKGVFVVGFSGVGSSMLTDLRKNLKAIGTRFFITKNKFISLAFRNSLDSKMAEEVIKFIDGPIGLVFVKDDPVVVCKALTDFRKVCEKIDLRGGYLNQQIINKDDFKVISSIPPREVLYQQLVTAINSPIARLAMSLNHIIGKLVYALNDLVNKKQKK